MPNSDFIPPGDNDLLLWAETLHAKLSANPAAHGLSVEKVTALEVAKADFRTRKAAVADIVNAAKRVTAEKDQSGAALIALGREIARLVKGHEGYTEAEGKDLGIVGHKASFDPSTAKPVISGTDKTNGEIVFRFPKLDTEGVNFYFQLEGETTWTLAGRANHSPFTHSRPLRQPGKAEFRRYTAIYVIHDKEVGLFSDVFEITCSP
ncbi:hypothetical protein [uncultured Thiodictyon sp.]|uniref:hypothetical protein n=1 Tax=uncultured Thiodictyon sp. TaxID=1846217 RepID=UPI0025F559B4|nr:hypothetical protein [uncultured Thiodictyon sp.]